MNTLLPVASGKGGVGKTLLVANLGVSLARQGKTVILVDLDLGGSNLHTCLGVKNRNMGIGNYIYKEAQSLESLIVDTGVDRLYFVPGDSLLPGTANLQYFMKKKILRELPKLTADFIILDLGAGTSYNILDFFLTTYSGLLVTIPETTAILNTYSFIKSALYRMLYRSFPRKSRERKAVHTFLTKRIEGAEKTLEDLILLLREISEEAGTKAQSQLYRFYPRIVLNMGRTNRDLALGSKLREIVYKNLGIKMEYIGFIGYDNDVTRSILERTPMNVLMPQSDFTSGVNTIARNLITAPLPEEFRLYEGNEDLSELIEEDQEQDTETVEIDTD